MQKEREEGERRKQLIVKKRDQRAEEREKNGGEVCACARNFFSRDRERKSGVKEREEEDECGQITPLPSAAAHFAAAAVTLDLFSSSADVAIYFFIC